MTTTQQKIEVMQAYMEGGPLEFRNIRIDEGWVLWESNEHPEWNWDTYTYRVKRPIPDSINWNHVE